MRFNCDIKTVSRTFFHETVRCSISWTPPSKYVESWIRPADAVTLARPFGFSMPPQAAFCALESTEPALSRVFRIDMHYFREKLWIIGGSGEIILKENEISSKLKVADNFGLEKSFLHFMYVKKRFDVCSLCSLWRWVSSDFVRNSTTTTVRLRVLTHIDELWGRSFEFG